MKATAQCCNTKCTSDDCKTGCGLWLQKSSLNSDSPKDETGAYTNHKLLLTKCQKDCRQGSQWKSIHNFISGRKTPTNDETPTDPRTFNDAHTAPYWKKNVGHNENSCELGCRHYFTCLPK
jgi:hypothetical protein